jgi:hypothetical protein
MNKTEKVNKWLRTTSGLASVGVWLADIFVGLWKFVARPSLCVPPPERQAAKTLCATSDSAVGNEIEI